MADGLAEALVHGEPGPGPVAGGAHVLLLLHNTVAVLVLPVPHPLQDTRSRVRSSSSTLIWVAMPAWSVPGTHRAA